MKFLSLTALIAFSSAFTIPNGTGNGLYVHTLHKNGSHSHIHLSHALNIGTVRRTATSAKFGKRVNNDPNKFYGWTDWWNDFWNVDSRTWVHCGNGQDKNYKLSQHDLDGAKALFHKGCISTLNLGNDPNDFYVVYGNVVMFMCNWGHYGQWCKNAELDLALDRIKPLCGDGSGLNTGWFNYVPWAKAYGFDHVDNKFCRE